MVGFPGTFWGPHPIHAILPVLLVLGVVGWVVAQNPWPIEAAEAQKVIAVCRFVPGAEAIKRRLA